MEGSPKLPIAISYVGSKYLIFDISAVTWVRKVHHICGVMTGTLPQSPSQNIFLGLPVQIMPEEAQLLVEKGVAYVVDDARAHDLVLQTEDTSNRTEYLAQIRRKGVQISMTREQEKEEARRRSLKTSNVKSKPRDKSPQSMKQPQPEIDRKTILIPNGQTEKGAELSLFDSTATIKPDPPAPTNHLLPHAVVPTTSDLWLPTPQSTPSASESVALLPNVPPSYALYKHLNSKAYFISPGLRFGCQYCVYPGDPLRFHSHFLAVGKEWDEEIDLMSIVGGGRLGTGVKKAFLIGGRQPPRAGENGARDEETESRIRTFSIEWAAM